MKIHSEADLDSLGMAAKLLAVITAWSHRGYFRMLADAEGLSAIADLPGDRRALEITAPVLIHAGLLDGGEGRVGLSATGRALLESGAMPTANNFAYLQHLSQMADLLESGGPARNPDGSPRVTTGGVRLEDPDATRHFLDFLYRRSEDASVRLANVVAPRLPDGGRVLDVGGGHGRYAEAFVVRGFAATVFDWPLVVELCRERHGDALTYQGGNFHDASFEGGPYDAALLSNIVHGESGEANADLVRRVAAALAPGGLLVVKDMFLDEQGADPENAVFFGVTMLLYTQSGRSYGLRELGRWCEAAGLEPPRCVVVGGHGIAMAVKRA